MYQKGKSQMKIRCYFSLDRLVFETGVHGVGNRVNTGRGVKWYEILSLIKILNSYHALYLCDFSSCILSENIHLTKLHV